MKTVFSAKAAMNAGLNTLAQYQTLQLVAKHDGETTRNQIVNDSGLTYQTVRFLVAALRKRGLVSVIDAKPTQRVQLTDRGASLLTDPKTFL